MNAADLNNPAWWTRVDTHIERRLDYWIEQLTRLCNQPSVAATGEGIAACAALTAAMLEEQGFAAEVMPGDGHPVVYAEAPGRSNRTILLYLHYDVQPADPLALWDSPPFRLTRRDNRLYARGVSDDKGHIICRLAALAALREVLGEFPCRVKFIIEGEEEIGSPHMPAFVARHREKLAADACIWEFGGVDHQGRPRQRLGMRGICYVELSVAALSRDAHSGLGGSIFPNPAWRLTWALNSLKDRNEQVLIPGFYDRVQPPDEQDLALLARLPDEADDLKERYGLTRFLKGTSENLALRRQAVFEPTCTICGLTAGYQGPGSKTVLPAAASAKVDFRLVPDQRPEEIVQLLRAHLDAQGFSDVALTVHGSGRPAKTDPDHPLVRLALETAAEVYGQESLISPMIGGSGPNYPFIHDLKLPLVTAGVGYPGSQAHAPNENLRLDYFLLGTRHTARLIGRFALG